MFSKQGLQVLVFVCMAFYSIAQPQSGSINCTAKLENDLLTLENNSMARVYKWNNGNLITQSVTNKANGKIWNTLTSKPDMSFPGQTEIAVGGNFSTTLIPETAIAPSHVQATVVCKLGSLEVKRVFRLYNNCAAIACDLYFRGEAAKKWVAASTNAADLVNLEKITATATAANTPVVEKLELPGKHWKLNCVEFLDITDRYNTLVFEMRSLSYRPNAYKGSLLFAHDNVTGHGVFILKEAATSNVQLSYPGNDFLTDFGAFRVIGAGLDSSDLNTTEWKRGYGFVTGVYEGAETDAQLALRQYQNQIRLHKPGRDEMVLMNTWGDRGQDSKVREKFTLLELEAGAKLGITHFQIDDGWQSGRSSNSAQKGGTLEGIWSNKNYWVPDPEKFPNGLAPVVQKGKELGIEVCLWFNPSKDNSNANWEKDADVLIGFYKQFGIRTFKIDGVSIPDKQADINFRKFLDKVNIATNNNVVFNLDVTAGRRGGYHYFNEYGNIFLENRYTDWQNYYPYTTLRNLWMLSKYVPPQKFQIEFLNKWRNADKYSGDPFGPSNYTFDYLFAIAMAAQPLAWFEGTGLPAETFATMKPVIRTYLSIQHDFQSGKIFPIGDEPSGKSFTGFQSILEKKGYFLVYREATNTTSFNYKTWLLPGQKINCKPVMGIGKAFTAIVGNEGGLSFNLPQKNSYAMYSYEVL